MFTVTAAGHPGRWTWSAAQSGLTCTSAGRMADMAKTRTCKFGSKTGAVHVSLSALLYKRVRTWDENYPARRSRDSVLQQVVGAHPRLYRRQVWLIRVYKKIINGL